jgi:chromosome segregation ATPase
MIMKAVKLGVIGVAGLALAGGLLFGTDALSYVRSSARSVQVAVKDAVPIEFELKRAKDMLDEIIPEMHANVRLIAQEEVEVAGIKSDIGEADTSLAAERGRITRLRDMLNVQQASYSVGGLNYSREQVKEELSRQFDRYKEAEMVLAGKKRLLDTREKALQAAMAMLERTRSQKVRLEDQIQALEGQYRLVKAASVGSAVAIDNSKLAQTERLIGEVRRRLDVAERVLAHEAKFVQPMPIDSVSEPDLVSQVDEYFSADRRCEPVPTPVEQHGPSTQPAGSVVMAPAAGD